MPSSSSSENAGTSFQFIVSDTPGPVKDAVLRKTIRKQAMMNAGRARRLRGNHGRVNLGQPVASGTRASCTMPTIPGSKPNQNESSTTKDDKSVESSLLYCKDTARQVPPCDVYRTFFNKWFMQRSLSGSPGYDRVRNKFQIDLSKLSMLTSFNITKSIINGGSADRERLATLMEHQQWSFLEFVPSMYDSDACIAAATDCLLARVSSILLSTIPNLELELGLYAKALKLLQGAIENRVSDSDAGLWCAVQLMTLRDLLDPSRADAWASHVQGCACLIQRRTPSRIKSELEKALFAAHIGPLLSEAFKSKKPCYLERPEWMKLYMSLIHETDCLTRRSKIAIEARALMFTFHRVWRDVDTAVRGEDFRDDDKLHMLEIRCRKLHTDLLGWMKEYMNYCLLRSLSEPSVSELCLRRELLGAVIDCLVLVKRMLATVCDNCFAKLENEIQGLAQLMLDIQRFPSPKYSWMFGGHETRVAQALVLTTNAYAKDVSCEPLHERRLHMRECYLALYRLLRLDPYTSQS